jgi:hypothetical protein
MHQIACPLFSGGVLIANCNIYENIQPLIEWVLGAIYPGIKLAGPEAVHFLPSYVELSII